MKTLLDLAEAMERKAASVEKAASDLAIKTAQTIVGDLAFKTPVDSSQALSNWIVTLESKSNEKIKPHFPGLKGSTQKQSAAETINAAKAVLKNKKPGQKIFITNNLPYIRRLNNGYSGQAPAGFVERAVLIGRKMKRNFKKA
jgi:hypothetical protein